MSNNTLAYNLEIKGTNIETVKDMYN